MLVRRDRELLQSPLIDVPHARRPMMGMPVLRMRDGKPTKELGNLLVLACPGPDHEIPVIAHQYRAEYSQGDALVDLGEYLFEGREVGNFLQ